MKKKTALFLLGLIALITFFIVRNTSVVVDSKFSKNDIPVANKELHSSVLESFLNHKSGDTIRIPKGTYFFATRLIINKPNITIIGSGINQTVLSFKKDTIDNEGIFISSDSVTIEKLSLIDTKGPIIKIDNSKNVILRDIRTTWSKGPYIINGEYGIKFQDSQNIVVENCETSNASLAGISFHNSDNISIQNNYTFNNVLGIELENCNNLEMHHNLIMHNTQGLFISNNSNSTNKTKQGVKVYNNEFLKNNFRNFSKNHNPTITPGVGIVLSGISNVEVKGNIISDHKTIGTALLSNYNSVDQTKDNLSFLSNVFIHNNRYIRNDFRIPDFSTKLGREINKKFYVNSQDIIYDGLHPSNVLKRDSVNPMNIYIDQSSNNIRFSNLKSNKTIKEYKGKLKVSTEMTFLQSLLNSQEGY